MHRTDTVSAATDHAHDSVSEEKKQYTPPNIVHELELETRAGTPLTGTNPLTDPFGLDSD